MKLNNDKWKKLKENGLTENIILKSYEKSVDYMATLNLVGA